MTKALDTVRNIRKLYDSPVVESIAGWARDLFLPAEEKAPYTWPGLVPYQLPTNWEHQSKHENNTIIVACVMWICRNFPEAPLSVWDRRENQFIQDTSDLFSLVNLVERPNSFYSGAQLHMATLADWITDGNAYWRKIRSEANRVVELWWMPSFLVEPKGDENTFITHYEYKPNPGKPPERLPPSEVVHFRNGLDRNNPRKGYAPLKALLKEVFTDEEAIAFTAYILKNLGMPGAIVSPEDEEGEISEDQAVLIKEQWMSRTTGSERGKPIVLSSRVRVNVLNFSPQQMNLKELRRVSEERVSAVLGIPAQVVGLGAGLDRSTFSNYAEAREAAYEQNIIPTQGLIAGDLNNQLLPDFTRSPRYRCRYDLGQVRVLQEDKTKLFARETVAWKAGWKKRSEVRKATGHTAGPEDDVYVFEVMPQAATGNISGAEDDPLPDRGRPRENADNVKQNGHVEYRVNGSHNGIEEVTHA